MCSEGLRERYVNPYTDFAFKLLFGTDLNKEILIGFLNALFDGKQVIEADIPMSELFGYNTDLRSMTGGLGDYSYEFSRYEQAPGDVQKREIEARAAAKDGE